MMSLLPERTLVHFGRRLENNAPRLARRAGGAVLTGPHTGPLVSQLRALGEPLLFQDVGAPHIGVLPRSEEWFAIQEGIAAVYTTPVVYVESRDKRNSSAASDLATAIGVAKSFQHLVETRDSGGEVLSVLALHHHWASRDSNLLLSALKEIDGPVGIMLWSSGDPYREPRAIEGMLDIIRERGQVAILRSDLAAIGFQAFGSVFGSIGVGTGTRHFCRWGDKGFADLDDPSPRPLIPSMMAYWKGTRAAAVGSDPLLKCPCAVCQGQDLARFVDPALKQEAAEHSVEAWMTWVIEMESMPRSRRESWWIGRVRQAVFNGLELEERIYLPEPASKQLESWCKVLGVPVF